MIVILETEFDRLFQAISKKELRDNSRIKKRMNKIRYTLALLRNALKPGKFEKQKKTITKER